MSGLKILSFNVNGLLSCLRRKGLRNSQLLTFLTSFPEEFNVICLQETKLSEKEIDYELANVPGWEVYYSCCQSNLKTPSHYSGVATFCREGVLPVSSETTFPTGEGQTVENEGRLMITNHGDFAIINVYAPAIRTDDKGVVSEERLNAKIYFNEQIENLLLQLRSEGKKPFLVGDLNIAIDEEIKVPEGDPPIPHVFRNWLKSLVTKCGLTDTFRFIHPDRKDAYTCWNTMTGARVNNDGRRLDYILCPSEFCQLRKNLLLGADLYFYEEGSDHCPIHASFSSNIASALGRKDGSVAPGGCSQHLAAAKVRQKRVTDFFVVKKRNSDEIQDVNSESPTKNVAKKQKSEGKMEKICPLEEKMRDASAYLSAKEISMYVENKSFAPLCAHSLPCIKRGVKKAGPNFGRNFWSCVLPQGSDGGRASSSGKTPAATMRCTFFKWEQNAVLKKSSQ